jgi:type I restriction enzyme S subunit
MQQTAALRSALFSSIFGDPVQNKMGWNRVTFGSVIEAIDSGWSPACLDRPANENEWGILKLSAVTSCEYDDTEQKALPSNFTPRPHIEVRAGDILVTRKNTRDLLAACALVAQTRPKHMLSDLIYRIRLKANAPVSSVFIHALLTRVSKRREVQALAAGSAGSMPNISKEKLRSIRIEVPPFNLQHAFAARVAEIEKLKAYHRAHLAKLDALFASLQHRAFRGEL